jgi:hypothetical protein
VTSHVSTCKMEETADSSQKVCVCVCLECKTFSNSEDTTTHLQKSFLSPCQARTESFLGVLGGSPLTSSVAPGTYLRKLE